MKLRIIKHGSCRWPRGRRQQQTGVTDMSWLPMSQRRKPGLAARLQGKIFKITELRACNILPGWHREPQWHGHHQMGVSGQACYCLKPKWWQAQVCKIKQWQHCRMNGFWKLWNQLDEWTDQASKMQWEWSICSPHAVTVVVNQFLWWKSLFRTSYLY